MHAADSASVAEDRTRHTRPADRDYDLIVIGGGAAGLAAAHAGAAARARTLLVSEGEIGGECTFTGCVPSKTLIEAAARGATFAEAIAAVRKAVAAIAATETAAVLERHGIEVTVMEAAPRLLPAADPAAAKVIGQVFAAEGITVHAGTGAEEIMPKRPRRPPPPR